MGRRDLGLRGWTRMRGTCGDSGGGGREECVGEAMDGEELRRREVAAVIWKGGGGGCDLEGRRSGVRGERG